MSAPTREEAIEALTGLLAPAVAELGLDLEEIDVRPAGRRRLVRIIVDGDDGVSLDDITTLSRTASELLDGAGTMGTASYVLEVSSPGVDRPLTEPRHWRRAVGRLVVAPLTEGGQIEGRVVSADDETIVIDVVDKRRGKGSGGKGPGGKGSGEKGPGGKSGPKSGGPHRGGPKSGEPATARRRFGRGDLGRGRVQVEFRPMADATGPADEADQTRSPAQPD
ncbi:ribosome maturation factor RimP [Spirillospora sp. NBC_01491]|uniref:ribosome maturation factor RimP n=1 Tax=Thermomonosporaceae TaxID=2012 RepID=UPI002E33C708|nr:ribosome maturation factor RimP [Spirillospora sp. NBC_01491]